MYEILFSFALSNNLWRGIPLRSLFCWVCDSYARQTWPVHLNHFYFFEYSVGLLYKNRILQNLPFFVFNIPYFNLEHMYSMNFRQLFSFESTYVIVFHSQVLWTVFCINYLLSVTDNHKVSLVWLSAVTYNWECCYRNCLQIIK